MDEHGTRPPGLAEVIKALGFEADAIEALGDSSPWRPVLCPFHDDKHPSASASTEVGGFACHACGIKGDSWSLILQFKGIPKEEFGRAVEWAAANVGYISTSRRREPEEPWRSPWAPE
jgi:DNA primase